MTELRDVRFQQALESAPDAHMAPDTRTRLAIQNMAAEAVKPKPVAAAPLPVAWWRRLLGSGSSRMPWNAAFATVLLASFVTVLWHDRPVPDAQLDEAPAKASREARPQSPAPASSLPARAPAPVQDSRSEPQSPSQRPAPAPAQAGAGAGAQAGAMHAPPTDAAAAPGQRQQQGGTNAARKQAPVREPVAPPASPPRAANQGGVNVDAPAPAPLAPSAPSAPSAPAPAQAAAAPPPVAFPQSIPRAPAPAAAAPAAPAPTPALPAAPKATAEQGSRADAASAPPLRAAPGLAAGGAFSRAAPASSPDSPALQGWDTLRITQSGQTTHLPRAQVSALAAQARRLAPTTGSDSLPGAISLRIEFAQGDETLAVLELGEEPWVRWALLRPGFAGRWAAQADRGQLMSLQLELRRLGVGPR